MSFVNVYRVQKCIVTKRFLRDAGLRQRNVSFFSWVTKTKGRTSVIVGNYQMAYIHVVTHPTTKATEARDTTTDTNAPPDFVPWFQTITMDSQCSDILARYIGFDEICCIS
jgi:hypothetical protein